jgi:hypothetical protein
MGQIAAGVVDPAAIVGPALLAGSIAIGATVAIERFGGVLGGLLATLPTTVVPASWAFLWASSDEASLRDALGAVPVGMLVNAGFLYVWRVLPPYLAGSLAGRLVQMTAVSLGAWAVLAAIAVSALSAARDAGVDVWWVGCGALGLTLGAGVVATWQQRPAPRGGKRVPLWNLAARGVLAGLAIGVAGALAGAGGELIAAMASVFPAIFLTAMVSLWWSQGDAVPAGAVGPMMLGSSSVSAYALGAAFLLPALGPWLGAAAAWGLAVVAVTVPAWAWTRRRRQQM